MDPTLLASHFQNFVESQVQHLRSQRSYPWGNPSAEGFHCHWISLHSWCSPGTQMEQSQLSEEWTVKRVKRTITNTVWLGQLRNKNGDEMHEWVQKAWMPAGVLGTFFLLHIFTASFLPRFSSWCSLCVRACVRACVRVCVCVCVGVV